MKYNRKSIISWIFLLLAVGFMLAGIYSQTFQKFINNTPQDGLPLVLLIIVGLPIISMVFSSRALDEIRKYGGKDSYLIKGPIIITTIWFIFIFGSFLYASSNMGGHRKSPDAKTKAQLGGLRAAAEVYWDRSESYGPTANDCRMSESIFSDTASGMFPYTDAKNYSGGKNFKILCSTDGKSYAVSAGPLTSGGSWCVDSSGESIVGEVDYSTSLCKPTQ